MMESGVISSGGGNDLPGVLRSKSFGYYGYQLYPALSSEGDDGATQIVSSLWSLRARELPLLSLSLITKSTAGRTSPNVALNRFVSLTYRSRWGMPLRALRRNGIEDESRVRASWSERLASV